MLIINNVKFAKSDNEFQDGDFFGFYRAGKNKIFFKDKNKKVFAALIKNKHGFHFVNCGEHNGRKFYQFALSENHEKLFGLYGLGYSQQIEKIKNYANEFVKSV